METQIMISSSATSSTTTPYATAPSSPHRFPTFFYSAPTSPIHHIQEDCQDIYNDSDFAFDFSGQIESPSISAADELFHCGKIKPLNPFDSNDPPNSFSPRYKKKKNSDSFIQTFHQTTVQNQTTQNLPQRGRQTTTTRIKISDILSDEDINQKNSITWYNKWNLKNLLLFRSASEGSATRSKMPVNKYSRITKCNEDVKNASFRSTDSRSVRKVSAHEMHYTANRAVAEEMKRKTYLPYKSGLFGCLGFHNNGGSVHEISRGITTVMKQRGY